MAMPNATPDWAWVTNEIFDRKLAEIVDEMGIQAVLSIPGVYEVLAEHLNNTVLEELEDEREQSVQ